MMKLIKFIGLVSATCLMLLFTLNIYAGGAVRTVNVVQSDVQGDAFVVFQATAFS